MQLGKLRERIGGFRERGAEVLAISNDDRDGARQMAGELGGAIPVLADPSMHVIYRYGMKGQRMAMADMGYVVIDHAGVIRHRTIDRQFGEHAEAILNALKVSPVATQR